jgi:hypothetical protein
MGRWGLSWPLLPAQLALARFWPPAAGEENFGLAVLFTKRATAVPTPLAPHGQSSWSQASQPKAIWADETPRGGAMGRWGLSGPYPLSGGLLCG